MRDQVLADRTAIVTGASKGIGKTIAETFGAAGGKVVICSRSIDGVEPVAAAIDEADNPGEAIPVECDVTQEEEVTHLVDVAEGEFGRIDALVNNAGAHFSDDNIHRINVDSFDKNYELNLKAHFMTAKETIPVMAANDGGSIVFVSSINGIFGIGLTGYSAAKSGLYSLSRNIATQYGRFGIRSNVVSPGTIVTEAREEEMSHDQSKQEESDEAQQVRDEWIDQYPLGRFGRPEEVAEMVLFLASDRAGFISGTNINVDGGFTAGVDQSFEELMYDVDEMPTRS